MICQRVAHAQPRYIVIMSTGKFPTLSRISVHCMQIMYTAADCTSASCCQINATLLATLSLHGRCMLVARVNIRVCDELPTSARNVTMPAVAAERLQHGARSYRSISPACRALSSKPTGRRCCYRSMGQTDGRTDGRTEGRPSVT